MYESCPFPCLKVDQVECNRECSYDFVELRLFVEAWKSKWNFANSTT